MLNSDKTELARVTRILVNGRRVRATLEEAQAYFDKAIQMLQDMYLALPWEHIDRKQPE